MFENQGYPQKQVILGDIDGDGRGDYCVADAPGGGANILCWRNGGQGDTPAYWEPMGRRVPGSNFPQSGDSAGFRLEDINGDGRDDIMWVCSVAFLLTSTNADSPCRC